MTSSEFC